MIYIFTIRTSTKFYYKMEVIVFFYSDETIQPLQLALRMQVYEYMKLQNRIHKL